jgi:hypothetical protein
VRRRAAAVTALALVLACGGSRGKRMPMDSQPAPASLTLELRLGDPVDTQLGLEVPALVLEIVNTGGADAEIPESGVSMFLRLQTRLERAGVEHARSAGTGKQVAPRTRMLPAGERVKVTVSPLDDGPGESPLDEGAWTARVCLDQQCSNPVTLQVARR